MEFWVILTLFIKRVKWVKTSICYDSIFAQYEQVQTNGPILVEGINESLQFMRTTPKNGVQKSNFGQRTVWMQIVKQNEDENEFFF